MAYPSDERLEELTDRLENGIKELFASGRYAEYLAAMSKFHRYSYGNAILILMQCPHATRVAGYNTWRKSFGRNVKRSEKGIQILAPCPSRKYVWQEVRDPHTGAVQYNKDGTPKMERTTVVIWKVVLLLLTTSWQQVRIKLVCASTMSPQTCPPKALPSHSCILKILFLFLLPSALWLTARTRKTENGYKNRSGKNWHPSSINGMLRNIQYIGILRSGESRSQVQEHLRLVDDKTFDTVQSMLAIRSRQNQQTRSAPVNTRGESLLAGNVFCGHCGARLCITTSGQGRPRKDGTDTRRVRYTCQTKSRTHGDCDGQTGYTVHILDEKIDMMVRGILAKAKRMTRTEVMLACYNTEMGAKKAFVKKAEKDLAQAEAALRNFTQELEKLLRGESQFTAQMLNAAYLDQEQRCIELREMLSKAKQELEDGEAQLQEISRFYDDMLEWAFAYDNASMSAKKMIVSHLIDRVYVFRDYRLQIKFNMSIEQFLISLVGAA